MARAHTTVILPLVLLTSIAAHAQTTDARKIADQTTRSPTAAAADVPAFPSSPIWTIEVQARPVAPPVSAADRLFLALESGVTARRILDGSEIWQSALVVDGPMAASGERLIVAAKGELHVLEAATGVVAWSDRTGPVTAPPLLHGDVLFIASGEQLTCYRLADGTRLWTRDTGAVEQRPAIDATRVYVSSTDGRVVALQLASGEPIWEYFIGVKPTEPLPYEGRVFVGAQSRRFCSLEPLTGRKDWCASVGAAVVGRPVADATHVYFVAFDNLIRAVDRGNGALRWKKDLRYRPSAGPMLVGESIAAPGSVARVTVFDARRGTATLQLTLPAALVSTPLLIPAGSGMPAQIAALTGGLPKVWTVTLAGPAPPSIPIAPITVLPGRVVPIEPPVLPGPLPPAGGLLLRFDQVSAPKTTAG